MTEETNKNSSSSKLIWDIPTRIFHWALAISILGSWYTMEISYDITKHKYCGYAILTLLLFRFVWGVFGTKYARFRNFIFAPRETLSYAKNFFSKNGKRYAGHNPLGAIAVFVMMLLILIQVVTGLFSSDNDYYEFGPFYFWIPENISYELTSLHFQNFDFLKIMIGVHIVAVFLYLILKKNNLITPMFTGNKNSLPKEQEPISHSKKGLALVIMAICIAIVYTIAVYAPKVSFF